MLLPDEFCLATFSPSELNQNQKRAPGGTPAPEPVCPEPPEHAGMPGPGLSLYSVLRPPSHSGRQITGCLAQLQPRAAGFMCVVTTLLPAERLPLFSLRQ